MTIDLASLGGGAGITAGLALLARLYATKRGADSGDFSTMLSTVVGLLTDERAAHARTRDRLDAAQTESEMHAGQIGDLAARAEAAIARCEEYDARVNKLEAENERCRTENAELRRRVLKLEHERDPARVTPPNDTPAVGVGQIRPPALPPMHETVGGYRHGR
jgi:hypothetical protein